MKIRVLQKLYGLKSGGVETIVVNLQKNMSTDFCFDYLTDRKGPEFYDAVIRQQNSERYSLDTDCIRCKIVKSIKFVLILNKFFEEHNDYDIVHINESPFQALIISMVLRKNGIKNIVIHAHTNTNSDKINASKVFSCIIRKMLPLFTINYIACSTDAAESMFDCKKHNRNLMILKDGIDVDKYVYNSDVRARLRAKYDLNEKFVMGNVGRLVSQKNQVFLINLMRDVIKIEPNAILILVGSGTDEKSLKKLVFEMELIENVVFWGETDQVHFLLQMFDLFLFPSKSEGFGMAALEAQAAGLKVISSNDVPKAIEVTDLVKWADTNNPEEWLKAIIEATKGYTRKNTRELIIRSGFDIKDSARKLEEYYRKVINT